MRADEQPSIVAVILAGGRGERFWPRSRGDLPKQFLAIVGDRTLLQQTHARAEAVAGADGVYVVTSAPLASRVRQQLPALPASHILIEPEGRDTGPALAFATAAVAARVPGAVLVALPADHLVVDDGAFAEACRTAARVAATNDRLVLLGVRPTRPETAYGYILPARAPGRTGVAPVARFHEKPSLAQALRLLGEGKALWNAGVFIWRPEVFLAAVERSMPEVRQAAEALAARPESPAARRAYAALRSISVDYGVLESADNVSVVPARFLWDDVGNWAAVGRLAPADPDENVVRGLGLAVESRRVTVESSADRLVVAFGLEDVVIVDSGDAVLVTTHERAADMKRVTEALRVHGYQDYLDHSGGQVPVAAGARVVDKPWGREVWWAETDQYLAKVLEIEAGQAISLQYHERKAESMLFLHGRGVVTVAERKVEVFAGLRVDIAAGVVHRVEAGPERLVLLEVSTPHPDDVVRLEDRYARLARHRSRTGGA